MSCSESPIQQVANMGQDLSRSPCGFMSAKGCEVVRRILHDLGSAIRQRSQSVAQQSALYIQFQFRITHDEHPFRSWSQRPRAACLKSRTTFNTERLRPPEAAWRRRRSGSVAQAPTHVNGARFDIAFRDGLTFGQAFRNGCLEERMRFLVSVKQVPDKDSRYKIDAAGTGIVEDDLVFETNESDQYALEEALRLKEKHSGEVVLLSLGDDRVLKSIKNGLAMGADRALHLTGTEFHGSDAHVVATAIQRAIAGESFDVILTGVQSDDLAFGQTGTILAQMLEWAHATIVMESAINPEGKSAQVKRELESNLFES